ncbi:MULTISPECIES: phosphopantetheine-binding protein [Micromonospora]|uniref:Acyl carrier protein n=1 Tax=Micromonospora mirobrigensis TaxID=262898 RepID=A0A1C4X1Q1_9ACTN|nr:MULTISPECIES: phosphopantetheine-binding protein [Micromonospora]WBC16760.1 phosphopantetheine-binding protein [Micromonospora sp. WMMA1998]WFE66772.1 phosphopantetheine-binding protein [Micromonospora sp. WMMD714]SCF02041.1 Acyl carrier protein [Micromonospora mirobrigensis]
MQNHLDTIRAFVRRQADGIADDEDIFANGYVNSLFAVQVIMFVEQTFGITVAGDDLDIRNFRSIAAIDQFVVDHAGDRLVAPL